MENSTYSHPSVLTLGFKEITSVRYFYGAIALLIYITVIFFNGAVIATIALHKTLQEPMYILVSALCMNGLYGTAAFFPSLIFNLFRNLKTISYVNCLTQLFCLHVYASCEMTILSIMALDRYVCIFNPLRYNNIMSLATVFKLIVSGWLCNNIMVGSHLALTIRLPLCDTVILKVYCDNWSVVRLSCVDTTINNIYGLLISISVTALMPLLIIISYIKIFKLCLRSSKEFRAKAWQTCSPHLITITTFTANLLFEILVYRFTPESFNYEIRTIMSVQMLVVPPLLNPIIYGVKLKEIHGKIMQTFHLKSSAPQRRKM